VSGTRGSAAVAAGPTGMVGLEVTGTPYEQGVQQGRALAGLIEGNLVQVERLIASLGVDARTYRGYVDLAAGHLAARDPDTLEELDGIADGSGIDRARIRTLNIPIYMVARRSKIVDDCSVFAVRSDATADGKTYLVKTRDQPIDQFAYEHVALTRRSDDGRVIVEVNAAGIITNPGNGINSEGLAVGTAGVWSKDRMGVRLSEIGSSWPMPDMHHLLRNATTVGEAIGLFADWPRLVGMNLVLADASGRIGTLELTATESYWHEGVGAGCSLTNHYVSPEIAGLSQTRAEYPSTHARLDFLDAALGGAERLGRDDIVALMEDRSQGDQDSIWRVSPDGKGSITRYGSVMCIEERSVESFGEDLSVASVWSSAQ